MWLWFYLFVSVALGQTICEKYAQALTITQEQLMSTIVGAVVSAELQDPRLKLFFDGHLPTGSTNFTSPQNTAAFNALAGGLVAFFGEALGCTDPAFPRYTGELDMAKLHYNMPITRADFNSFNDIFIATLQSLQVDPEDQVAIRTYLDSFVDDIVNPRVICPGYATATGLTQIALMTAIVDGVVGAEVADQTLVGFFDGTKPAGSTNFLAPANAARLSTLKANLVSFFGGPLGCNEANFPKYTGNPDMDALHNPMPISGTDFDNFNNIFISVLNGLNVAVTDQQTVRRILDSFLLQIVNPALICPKYATLLNMTQVDLMTLIVTTVVTAELGDSNVKPFFDGNKPVGSTDFTSAANTAQFNNLAGGLVAFFGAALGCNEPNFPVYRGNPDMKDLHKQMPIDDAIFTSFNQNFVTALLGLGVDPLDVLTVGTILETFRADIVNPSYICNKYSTALGITDVDLMTAIVNTFIPKEVSDPAIVPYFDGTIPPGSTDFTTDDVKGATLASHLVEFFGPAIGCDDVGFPPYTGNPDMKGLHAPMKLTDALFDKFNGHVIDALQDLGVARRDRDLVLALLDSFRSDIVFSDAPPPPTGDGDPDLVAAGYTLFQPLDCDIFVYWRPLDTTTGTVDFAVRRQTDGWVALGFPAGGAYAMIGSDAVIGWVDGTGADSVMPYSLNGKTESAIVNNPKLEITDVSAIEENGVTTIYFTRVLNSGANPIKDISSVAVIASTRDGTDAIQKHSCKVGSVTILNLEDGSGTGGDGGDPRAAMKNAHGALMIIGWGSFLVIGVLAARYGREKLSGGVWFRVHQVLQTTGMVLTTVAFILAWIMVDGVHFNTRFHAQLGLTVMILAYIQFLGGVIRPHREEGSDPSTLRKVFEIVHPWMGRIILVLATITVFAGINTWWHWWVNILYGVVLGFFGLFIIVGEATGLSRQDPERV